MNAYRKAIIAAFATGLGVLATAWSDGNLTPAEICGVIAAMLGGGGVTYAVPNTGTNGPVD